MQLMLKPNTSVCQYSEPLKRANIQVVIIGVGNEINSQKMLCLTESDEDFIQIDDFTQEDFDSIQGSLSFFVCPRKRFDIDLDIDGLEPVLLYGIIGVAVFIVVMMIVCGVLL